MLNFISQFSLIKKALRFSRSRSLSKELNKKLNAIERKILTINIETIESTPSLLGELIEFKKEANNHFLIPEKNQFHTRSDHLKQFLLKKSFHIIENIEIQELAKVESYGSTHHRVLSLMNQHPENTVHITQNVPRKLYWRYAKNEISTNQYGNTQYRAHNPSLIYLQTSSHNLLQLLLNKINNNLLQNKNELKVVSQNFEPCKYNKLVCGLSLKLMPMFNPSQGKTYNNAFWQQLTSIGPQMLANFKDKNLTDHISEIFFQDSTHYDDFKNLLHRNQEFKLLDLITDLEAKSQIVIPQHHALGVPVG